MKKNAMKSMPIADNYSGDDFPWTDAECSSLGVERSLAYLAWNVLNGFPDSKALSLAGYNPRLTKMWLIASRPNYLRAMRVMSTQYLNAVAFPIAVKALVGIALDDQANQAAKAKAANVLMDYGVSTLQAFKNEFGKDGADMTPAALDKMIKHLETETRNVVDAVQIDVQMTEQEDYLSDMS